MNTSSDDMQPAANAQPACRNCGAPMLGAHCYACGQPVKGLVRPLGNLFGDLLDSVFNVDTRILRTLPPLFAKPGFLTTEYFAGRQVRYVTPVRLFFFLAIITFFLAKLATDLGPDVVQVNGKSSNDLIGAATTVTEVEKERDARLADMAEAKKEMAGTPAAAGIPGMEAGEQAIRDTAAERIRQLQEAQAKGLPPPEPMKDSISFDVDGKPWHAQNNPIDTWAPAFVDRWLNDQVARGNGNIERLKKDRSAFKDAVLSAVPTTLFVLLIHAAMDGFSREGSALAYVFGWIEGLLIAWMPLYLLLMQKRVYQQGWPMTLLKYCVLGTCYTILLSFAILASMAIGLVAM